MPIKKTTKKSMSGGCSNCSVQGGGSCGCNKTMSGGFFNSNDIANLSVPLSLILAKEGVANLFKKNKTMSGGKKPTKKNTKKTKPVKK